MSLKLLILIVVCLTCVEVSRGKRVYGNYTGDILLAAFFPIHQRKASGGASSENVCGEIQEKDGIQAMEAFFYTLDKINRDATLLKDYQLGAVILDSCDDDTHALEQAVDLIRVLMTRDDISNLPFRCPGGTLPIIDPGAVEFHKVVGVLGGSSSAVSLQLSSLLKLFVLPQVSYLSTSPDLSNQERYPFFKRTVPSDNYQARAIIELLVEFKWTYVSLIYEDSNYGTKGFAELERAASEYGVCFAYTKRIDFDEPDWKAADYETIIKGMTEKEGSKVAILWADFPRARELFLAASRLNKTDMHWVGSDGWSGRDMPVKDLGHVVRNAIAIQPLARKLGGFDNHFTGLTPKTRRNNPWFREFWEKHFDCKFPTWGPDSPTQSPIKGPTTNNPKGPTNGSQIKECTGNEEINETNGYKQQLSLHFISDAAYAFAHALSDMHNKTCGGVPGLCDAMKPSNISGVELLNYLSNVTFKSATDDEFKFINNVDGPPRYSIMHYRDLQPEGYTWVEAGTYYGSDTEGPGQLDLTDALRNRMSLVPPSSCSIPCDNNQARTFVKGERCCWACNNCSEWSVVVRITEETNDECFPCPSGTEPNDNRTWCRGMTPSYMDHTQPEAIVSMTVSFILMMLAVFATVVFAIYYSTPVVKASGRELTFILIGVIMLSYISTFVFVAKPDKVTCALTRILLGLSYTGIYSTILAKASRISRIFNDGAGSPKRARMTSPRSQMIIVGLIVVVEVLIIAIWIAASPPKTKYVFPNRATRLLVCEGSDDASYMVALLYPFLLMLACLVYAFKTRKTPDGFNETRLIAFTSYTTVIIWIAFVPLYFINLLNNKARTMTLCISLSLNATVALLCLLYPKVYICLFKPEKNTREAVMARSQSVLSSSSIPNATGDRPPDSPSGMRKNSRRNSSVLANQTWQTGIAANGAVSNGSIAEDPLESDKTPLKPRPRTNSGTQTTFSISYYAPVYEVSENEAIIDKINQADVDDVKLEFTNIAEIADIADEEVGGVIARGVKPKVQFRRVSITAKKALPDVQEDVSNT